MFYQLRKNLLYKDNSIVGKLIVENNDVKHVVFNKKLISYTRISKSGGYSMSISDDMTTIFLLDYHYSEGTGSWFYQPHIPKKYYIEKDGIIRTKKNIIGKYTITKNDINLEIIFDIDQYLEPYFVVLIILDIIFSYKLTFSE